MAGRWATGPADIAGGVRDGLVYVHLGLGEQPIPYLHGRELQRQIHGQRVNDEIPDTCLLLQHEPVFTAGKRTSPPDRPLGDPGAPVVEVDRACADAGVSSPSAELGQPVGVRDMPGAVERHLAGVLGAARWRRSRGPLLTPSPTAAVWYGSRRSRSPAQGTRFA